MKKIIITFAFILLAAVSVTNAKQRMDIDINFGYFYQNLSPYGTWMQIDDGIFGWRPSRVNFGWRPYSLGRWTWTEYGWYWDSYEPFGWATYHYGRWIDDEYYGWIWVPDYEWGPSWVEWRYDDDYIGWAPLPPYAGFRFGFGISFSFGWHSNYSSWNFVRFNHFGHHNMHNYFVDSYHVKNFFGNTKYRTNYFDRENRIINGGVDRDFIERRGGDRIRESYIRTTSDLRDVARNRTGNESYVRSFRPGDDDLKRTRDIEYKNITRPERNISIEKDRIAIRTQRDNNITVQKPSESRNENGAIRTERNNNTGMNREREVIRNDRQMNDTKAIERARENNETIFNRNNRAVEKREEAVREKPVVRENSKRNLPARGFEMNQNRSEQKVEKQAERKVTFESRNNERRAERNSSSDRNNGNSRERRR